MSWTTALAVLIAALMITCPLWLAALQVFGMWYVSTYHPIPQAELDEDPLEPWWWEPGLLWYRNSWFRYITPPPCDYLLWPLAEREAIRTKVIKARTEELLAEPWVQLDAERLEKAGKHAGLE